MNRKILAILIFVLITCSLTVSCRGAGDQPADAADTAEADMDIAFILADSVSESISSCSYNFRVFITGSYADTPELVGELTGSMPDGSENLLLRIEMGQDSTPDDGNMPELALTMVSGVDSAYAYSSDENIFEKGSLEEGGTDLLRSARYALMMEYFIDGPFAQEIASRSIISEAGIDVGGVECENYLVTYAGGQQARWSFGVEDNIPRRVERMMTDREGAPMSIVLEVYDLDTSPEISENTFTLTAPEGASVEIYSAFLTVGSTAPLWTLQDRDGNTVSLEDLRGSIVVMDFWATWCSPCIQVMPEIQRISETYPKDQVHVFGVNTWERGDPGAFMDENGFTYGLLLAGDEVAADYKVSGIPTMYVIGQNGNIAFVEVGANPEIGELLTTALNDLLETE